MCLEPWPGPIQFFTRSPAGFLKLRPLLEHWQTKPGPSLSNMAKALPRVRWVHLGWDGKTYLMLWLATFCEEDALACNVLLVHYELWALIFFGPVVGKTIARFIGEEVWPYIRHCFIGLCSFTGPIDGDNSIPEAFRYFQNAHIKGTMDATWGSGWTWSKTNAPGFLEVLWIRTPWSWSVSIWQGSVGENNPHHTTWRWWKDPEKTTFRNLLSAAGDWPQHKNLREHQLSLSDLGAVRGQWPRRSDEPKLKQQAQHLLDAFPYLCFSLQEIQRFWQLDSRNGWSCLFWLGGYLLWRYDWIRWAKVVPCMHWIQIGYGMDGQVWIINSIIPECWPRTSNRLLPWMWCWCGTSSVWRCQRWCDLDYDLFCHNSLVHATTLATHTFWQR